MSLIRLENVSLVRQGKTLLSDLNWTVEKGQTWAILGLNGAGKSTLLRLLTAEFFPSEGKAEILGYTFGNGDITGLRQHIGIVSSFITERLPKHMTAEKIVLTGKYKSSILYKAYGDKELQEAKDMLTSLGAGELIGRKYLGLSQGEKQICLIDDYRIDLLTLTPEERYKKLLTNEPKLLQEVPLHYLASFLGISSRHMSRIRKCI